MRDGSVGGVHRSALVAYAVGHRGGYTATVETGVAVGDVPGNVGWLRNVVRRMTARVVAGCSVLCGTGDDALAMRASRAPRVGDAVSGCPSW